MSKRRLRFPHFNSELWHISTCWSEISRRWGCSEPIWGREAVCALLGLGHILHHQPHAWDLVTLGIMGLEMQGDQHGPNPIANGMEAHAPPTE